MDRLQALANASMKLKASAGRLILVERVARDRVRELIPSAAFFDLFDQSCADRFLQRIDSLLDGDSRRALDESQVERPPNYRRACQEVSAGLREVLKPPRDDRADAVRNRDAPGCRGAFFKPALTR